MPRSISSTTEFSKLPFYYGIQQSPYGDGAIPYYLPFALGVCDATGLIVQVPKDAVQDALSKAYETEGLFLTTPMDESPLTRWRGDEFLDVMLNTAGIEVKEKRVFEIGCSTGALLNELSKRGATVRGCEPGPSALTARSRYGLNVDQGYFIPGVYDREFDIVIHLTVLEHVVDSVEFLAQTSALLNPGGWVFLGVPSCESQLRLGDPGMILHEHYSYFDAGSLSRSLLKAGFTDVQCHSTEKGVLYGWGRWAGADGAGWVSTEKSDLGAALEYLNKLNRTLARINEWVDHARQEKLRVGLYGASVGAANLWAMLNWDNVDVNLFDGEPAKKGRYLPGCELAIRPPEDLLVDTPDKLLILPISFAPEISRFLRQELCLPEHVQIDTLAEMLAD